MATAIVDDPYLFTSFFKKRGFLTAAELITTLSTPTLNKLSTSFSFLIPPPADTLTKIFLSFFLQF